MSDNPDPVLKALLAVQTHFRALHRDEEHLLKLLKEAIQQYSDNILEVETDRSKGSAYDIARGALYALERADDLNYPLQLEVERLEQVIEVAAAQIIKAPERALQTLVEGQEPVR